MEISLPHNDMFDLDMLRSLEINNKTSKRAQPGKSLISQNNRKLKRPQRPSPFHVALSSALSTLPPNIFSVPEITDSAFISDPTTPKSYTIYSPLLLFPTGSFSSPQWQRLLNFLKSDRIRNNEFWEAVAKGMRVSHLAINAPIPVADAESHMDNYKRLPISLHPLYGFFGPHLPDSRFPSSEDFNQAFWVHARQNGIFQTWAPIYTMFSRGNITEKTRILKGELPGLDRGKDLGETAAVDLYIGIGYFSFCYLKAEKANVTRVWGWEVSPWSVEGCKRGAKGNGWRCQIVSHSDSNVEMPKPTSSKEKENKEKEPEIVIFHEDNKYAAERITALRIMVKEGGGYWRPIRHVNCGLLPTSRGSWETAVKVLDDELGGWVHAHENVGVNEVEIQKDEVQKAFEGLAGPDREVEVVGGVKVKGWAPGVLHWVWDISISGRKCKT
ncbi:MAG: hypothetical protein M1834_004197 [Cirrosporium novae-zelandiae]|nr:MAG: hypothetical protein M1834_004197 [Cirrosporium novae-zelandiae]